VDSGVQIPEVIPSVSQAVYAPTSVEKKRAIVMYALFGIVMGFNKPQQTVFEYFHLKQAI